MAWDDLGARIFSDRRMSPSTRELANVMAWVLLRDPAYRQARGRTDGVACGAAYWRRVHAIVGGVAGRTQARDMEYRIQVANGLVPVRTVPTPGGAEWSRHRLMLAGDAPRYQPPSGGARTCVATMIRRSGICGQQGVADAVEYDLESGWVLRQFWYCRKHQPICEQMRAQLDQQKRPEPIPNVGGTLPCYFDADWPTLYAWARPRWKVPYYGVCADRWPVPGQDSLPRPPKLMVLPGGAGVGA